MNYGCLKQWMIQRHLQSEPGYQKAISYYETQRDYFLNQIGYISGQASQESWQRFIIDFNAKASEVNANQLSNTKAFENSIINPIRDLAKEIINNRIEGGTGLTSIVQDVDTKRMKKNSENYLRNYSDRIKGSFNNYIEQSQIIKSQLQNIYKTQFGIDQIASTSMLGMMSILRRAMLDSLVKIQENQSLLQDSNIQGYIQLFKGYNAEIIAEQGGNALLKDIKSKWSAAQVGGFDGSSDVIFGNGNTIQNKISLQNLLAGLENINTMATVDVLALGPLDGYGLQAKSWVLPSQLMTEDKRLKKQYYTIGMRGALYNSLNLGSQSQSSWWHNNILAVSKHLIQAIGAANILYVTGGNKYIWTADLIREFREMNYLLSFYYRRTKGKFYYPPTTEMTWQQEVSSGYIRGKYGNKDNDS